jgi:hypothetical protein
MDSTQLGSSTSLVYRGICNSAPGRGVDHSDIAAFRINYTFGGMTRTVTQPYNGVDSDAYVDLPGGKTTALAIRWNDVGEGARYTIELQLGSNAFKKCVDDSLLANDTSYVHTGVCPSTGSAMKIPTIAGIRVCAVWTLKERKSVCSDVAYDGHRPQVDVDLPTSM